MWQVWSYQSATGEECLGVIAGFNDFGGSDVTYRFQRLGPDGRRIEYEGGGVYLDCLSGARLKAARRVGAMPPHGVFQAENA